MRTVLALSALAAGALLAVPVNAEHTVGTFTLQAHDLDEPAVFSVSLEATLTFGGEGAANCQSSRISGPGTLAIGPGVPEPVWVEGCWGPGAATTAPMRLEVTGEEVAASFALAGPSDALVGTGSTAGANLLVTASYGWGLDDWAGFHEGEPLPCWIPPDPDCCPC